MQVPESAILQHAKPRRWESIGREIIYRETCYLAAASPHQIDVEFLVIPGRKLALRNGNRALGAE